MKSVKIGVLSAITVSICCIGPLILIALGLGSWGLGAVISKYHRLFLTTGILLILFSWTRYFKEKKKCTIKKCQMENKRVTLTVLIISTTIVLFFAGLNLYTYAGRPLVIDPIISVAEMKTISIPVEGMTCFSCEFAVSSALKKIDGVVSVKASAKEGKAQVKYDPLKTTVAQLIEVINKRGYKAGMPRGE